MKKAKGFGTKVTKSMTKYEAWERANIAFHWTFGIPPMIAYTQEDGEAASEGAVVQFLSTIHQTQNLNPLRKKYRNTEELLTAFNKKYPYSLSA